MPLRVDHELNIGQLLDIFQPAATSTRRDAVRWRNVQAQRGRSPRADGLTGAPRFVRGPAFD